MSNKRGKTSLVAPNTQNNGAGIQSMPHELLLEILQYLGPPLNRTTSYFGGTPPYPLNSERRETLLSLSQCCRALRSFFLPLAWEYVDACRAKNGHGECEDWTQRRKRQRNLELKSRGLVQNPNLAAYVRIVNVHIVKDSEGEVLSIFAQCLQSLPNVHTLQIAGVLGQAATAIKTAFKNHRFLQIRTIILPNLAHHALSSCPQVKDITWIGYQEDYVFNTILKRCKQVEALDIVTRGNNLIELIVKAMPNLCRISIRFWYHINFDADRIRLLAALPRLHTIVLREERESMAHVSQVDVEASLQPLIQAATAALKKHESDENGKKWVRVWHQMRHFALGVEDITLWTKDIEVEP